MTNDAPQLLPCPFCRSKAKYLYHNGGWPNSCYNVECSDWKCPSRSGGRPSEEAAAELWNTRADHAQADKEAAVAAEREAIVQLIRNAYPLSLVEDIRCEILVDEIRALGDTDALERVRQEAKAEALREAEVQVRGELWIRLADHKVCDQVSKVILALIPDQHKVDG